MAKHLKSSGTNMRHSEPVNPYTVWAVLNPEYAADDIRVERELKAMDEELRQAWEGDAVIWSAHGFNGHDPHDENDHLSRFPKSGIYVHDWHDPDPRFEDGGYDHDFYDDYEPILTNEERMRRSKQAEINDWYDEYPQYEFPDYEWEAYEASLVCEPDPSESEYLEDRYSLPYTQSLRMAVRGEKSEVSHRWNGPYSRGKRCKPSHRPRAGRR